MEREVQTKNACNKNGEQQQDRHYYIEIQGVVIIK